VYGVYNWAIGKQGGMKEIWLSLAYNNTHNPSLSHSKTHNHIPHTWSLNVLLRRNPRLHSPIMAYRVPLRRIPALSALYAGTTVAFGGGLFGLLGLFSHKPDGERVVYRYYADGGDHSVPAYILNGAVLCIRVPNPEVVACLAFGWCALMRVWTWRAQATLGQQKMSKDKRGSNWASKERFGARRRQRRSVGVQRRRWEGTEKKILVQRRSWERTRIQR
jgi:hypothetical protein